MADPRTLAAIAASIERGDADAAIAVARQALAQAPQSSELHRLLGVALAGSGDHAQALDELVRALELDPSSWTTLCNLASTQMAAGQLEAAAQTVARARRLAPRQPAVLNLAGNLAMLRGELPAARAAYEELLRHDDQHLPGWINLTETLLRLGDPAAAAHAGTRALALAHDHPQALALLGKAASLAGDPALALQRLRQARQAAPDSAPIALWLGHALEEAGDYEAAERAYSRAHELAPAHAGIAGHLLHCRRRIARWEGLEALSRQVRDALAGGHGAMEPFAFLSEDAGADEQLACARQRAAQLAGIQALAPAPGPRPHGAPRVGFVSNGFGEHPTGLLIVALIEALRGQAIQTHAFATTPDDGGPIRRRLRAAFDGFDDVAGLDHDAVAERIRAQHIEIAIDLRGWGGGGVPAVFSRRPAPVQVNWLAYPGTSGAPWIDYVIADRIVLPEALRRFHSEAVAWLPRCFQPSDTTRTAQQPPTRRECGLPEQAVVFASFNNGYKLNPPSFARMMAVLRQVPESVLWLLSAPGEADRRLREAAAAAGVAPQRLVFMRKQPHADYLARYAHADLFLDTLPYNAHTTASDALWAGCPLLTLPGRSFAARVAASLDHHLGMPQLIAADEHAYVAGASALGRDRQALAAVRVELQQRRRDSGLFDMDAFAADFAAVLEAIAQRHRSGLQPADLG